MKKNFFIVLGLISLLALISCADSAERKVAITYKAGDTYVTISVPKDISAKYINVYRGEVEITDVDDEGNNVYSDPESYVSIGQINSHAEDGMISYGFNDYLIVAEKSYKYSVRYVYENRSVSNGWSVGVTIASGDGTEANSPYLTDPRLELNKSDVYPTGATPEEDDGTYFVYSPDTYSLTCKYDTSHNENAFCAWDSVNEKEVEPAYYLGIAVRSPTKSRIFPIYAGAEHQGEGLSEDQSIDLRSILNTDFFNVNVEVIGFVYEYKEVPNDGDYVKYHWSVPAKVKSIKNSVKNGEDETNVIYINYDLADDSSLDYGNRSINNETQAFAWDSLDFSELDF